MKIRANGRLIKRTSKRVAKRGTSTRILLMLLDGQPHVMEELWSYVAAAVEPQTAARIFSQRYPKQAEMMRENPQNAVNEGTRVAILRSVQGLEKKGFITASYPELVTRYNKGRGMIDIRKATVAMAPAGFDHIINSPNIWGKIASELYLGIKQGRLEISVKSR